jgi:hypothetical protein
MKKILFSLLICSAAMNVIAQDGAVKALKADAEKGIKKDAADTASKIWKKGGMFSLNVNQGSLSNWSAGGDKFTFSLNAFLNTYAFYKKDMHSWDNNLDLAYGVINTTSLGHRKASDRIDLTSKYGYALTQKLNLALLGNVRSQFAKGYSYLKDMSGNDSASLTSKSFSPTYVLVSLGLDYKPNADLSLFFSAVTGRWVIAGDPVIGPIYGVPVGKKAKSEFGAYFSANYLKKISTNITYKGKLDLFSNYRSNPQNIDIFFSNALTAKISKYINFSLNLDIIYDDDTKNVNPAKGPAPQILQLMGIGFAYKFNQ